MISFSWTRFLVLGLYFERTCTFGIFPHNQASGGRKRFRKAVFCSCMLSCMKVIYQVACRMKMNSVDSPPEVLGYILFVWSIPLCQPQYRRLVVHCMFSAISGSFFIVYAADDTTTTVNPTLLKEQSPSHFLILERTSIGSHQSQKVRQYGNR